jgi:hypothetical protein
MVTTTSSTQSGWRDALRWGFGVALAHRLLLTMWLATVWLTVGEPAQLPVHLLSDPIAQLPAMTTPTERALIGIWRRWDGSHYLNLAQNGYRLEDPGPTVFGPLAPLGIRLVDAVLPSPLEIAGVVFSTFMFGLALTLLHRFVGLTWADSALARRSVIVMALLPLSYFFAAPMSEAPYLTMVLGFFVFGASRQWWLAALCGALATLARSQGVLLIGVGGLMLIWQATQVKGLFRPVGDTPKAGINWQGMGRYVLGQGWPLFLLPLAYLGFMLYRGSLGLPPIEAIFYERSYVALVDPVTGLLSNLRQIALDPINALQNVDYLALLIAMVLIGLMVWERRFRQWHLIAFCAGYLLVFVSKLNYPWGSYDTLLGTQSMARYTLTLFPLTILVTDGLWRLPKFARLLVMVASLLGLLAFSAQFALGGGPA